MYKTFVSYTRTKVIKCSCSKVFYYLSMSATFTTSTDNATTSCDTKNERKVDGLFVVNVVCHYIVECIYF